MSMKKHQNATYELKYHIVLVTMNSKEIINKEIGEFLKENISRLINAKGSVENMAYNTNHFFIMAEIQPQYSIAGVINSLKSATSRLVKRSFDVEMPFWDNNYFVTSIGEFSRHRAMNYIKSRT